MLAIFVRHSFRYDLTASNEQLQSVAIFGRIRSRSSTNSSFCVRIDKRERALANTSQHGPHFVRQALYKGRYKQGHNMSQFRQSYQLCGMLRHRNYWESRQIGRNGLICVIIASYFLQKSVKKWWKSIKGKHWIIWWGQTGVNKSAKQSAKLVSVPPNEAIEWRGFCYCR